MKLQRASFLRQLSEASLGLSKKEVLEQSDCFVFTEGTIVTYNDEIRAEVPCGLDFAAAVRAENFVKMLQKFPDEEVDILCKKSEIVIKGAKKSAGVSCVREILLPHGSVPAPGKWKKMPKGIPWILKQAARTCGRDETQPLATVVHVTPDRIEACDNFRFFRYDGETGFDKELLIPSASLVPCADHFWKFPGPSGAVADLPVSRLSVGDGWVFFRSKDKSVLSLRCLHSKYREGMDNLLEMDKPQKVKLPASLPEIIDRASVMTEWGYESRVSIDIVDGVLAISSRREGGWFKERKRVKYDGPPIRFEIHPGFLQDVLKRTRTVEITEGKMKVTVDSVQFIVYLQITNENDES